MSRPIDQARMQFRAGNFISALEIAARIGRTSKDHAQARQLIANCHYNIGVLQYSTLGQLPEAEESFRECLQWMPRHEDAHNSLAGILVMRGALEEAVPWYEKTLVLNPRRLSTILDLAVCLERIDQLDAASRLYLRLSDLAPGDGTAAMRDALLVPSIIPGREALQASRRRMDGLLDIYLESDPAIAHPERANGSYFYCSYHGVCNRDLNTKIAKAYLYANPALAWAAPHVAGWVRPAGRIRVGFLSENLCDHSIGQTSRGMIAELDRSRFEVVVVHIGTPRQDAIHAWINQHADRFVYVNGPTLDDARRAVASLELDIAFWQDIGMAPLSYFLAFARLAPVQLTSFGHPDTTGIPAMDCFLSSDLYEPADGKAHYSERLVTVPDAGTLAYYYRPEPPAALGREFFGFEAGDPLYICPQTLFKLHPDMDDLLEKIRLRDNRAKFVLIAPARPHLKAGILQRVASTYPELAQRLVFIPRISDQPTYKALLRCCDVMLDSVHFNGQNTNLEAFSVGLPVVTLPTGLQRGRHTLGMYRAMEFMDLVADSPDSYADLAVRLLADAAFAHHCRTQIARRCDVLYQNIGFVRQLERSLTMLVEERTAR